MGSAISLTGAVRLRAMSVASALSGRDVQRVQAGFAGRGEGDQGGQEAGQRLAAAGGRDQKHAFARGGGVSMAS